MTKLLHASLALCLLSASAAQASAVTVTSVSTDPALNTWYRANLRDVSTGYSSQTSADITGAQARSGNGSVAMSLTNSSGKADYVYTWGYMGGRTLGNLSTLGFDWMRAGGGSAAAHLQPAMRLLYDADGNAATTNDRGYLIWEQHYQGVATPTDTWVSSDILDGYFWQRKFSPGTTVEDFDITLDGWAAGTVPNGAVYDVLSASTAILGIEFGIGSGWNGSFSGYVDNVRFGFGGAQATTFNFELAQADVPEPASMILLGLGALGLGAARRRKQK
ncbi:PEP-CTERM sorting domain-containing protein [Massilia sp. G4R7]|uniref:PEP-CTERM sorting domain-containing protein n=1 Tax=Massilia phyllostachyos TaxID=2898585 RepID=A0ABS8QA95_9BURK|nr:PEP-CTERM sorting domain-containing protein [Massilia phyllostachyos]MCD2518663.1 PEP-CTERM sorting domain-containing protein [Massilia phyllostachyos]